MTKIALTPALIGSIALGVGAAAIDAAGRRKMQRQQEEANNTWLKFQDNKKRQAESIEQEERLKAQNALEGTLEQQTGDAIDETINTETDRLSAAFTEGLDATADSMIAGAQAPGRDQVFDEAMAGSIAKATGEARQRLAALARASAYGGGTVGGLGQSMADANADAGFDITTANQFRNSATNNLRRWQTVQPEIFEYKQSPLVPIMQAGSAIVGGLGGDFWTKNLLGGAAGAASSPVIAATQAGSGVASTGGGGGGLFTPTGGANPFGGMPVRPFSFMTPQGDENSGVFF